MIFSNLSIKNLNLINFLIFAFLLSNFTYRFSEIKNSDFYISLFVIIILVLCIFIIFFPNYLKILLFGFGASFLFYGFHSYSTKSLLFELILVIISLAMFFINIKSSVKRNRLNREMLFFLLTYIGISLFSLLLLPISNFWESFALWDIDGFSSFLLNAKPNSFFYSFSAANRLILFLLFVILLARSTNSNDLFKKLLLGALSGCILASTIGLLEYFDVISLKGLRDYLLGKPGIRLQSTFGNPGWYAEFATITLPFLLFGIFPRDRGFVYRILSLLLCGVAVILTKSRGGWIALSFILFVILLVVFFTKRQEYIDFLLEKNPIIKIVVTMLIIACSISIFLIIHLPHRIDTILEKNNEFTPGKEERSIRKRAEQLFNPWDLPRLMIWYQAYQIGKEKPLLGVGYESYGWHASVQKKIPNSNFAKSWKFRPVTEDTPHNLYLQLFISGGLTGLLLWMIMTLYALILLIYDFFIQKNYFNFPVIISIICFHIYGIFQSMQYIPMIWFIIFLNFGYAMTISEKVLPSPIRKISRIVSIAFLVMIFVGGLSYFQDIESNKLAKKYGIDFYAINQNRDKFIGFYNLEKWEEGNYRWSGGKGIIRFDGGGLREVNFQCHHPDVEIEPVKLSVFLNDEPLDHIVFSKKKTVKRQYHIPEQQRKANEMLIKVSRTWNPRKYGSSDNRNIGVAVSEMKLVDKISEERERTIIK